MALGSIGKIAPNGKIGWWSDATLPKLSLSAKPTIAVVSCEVRERDANAIG